MKFFKPENPYEADYHKLTIRQWREHIMQVASEAPPDPTDKTDIELRIGTLKLADTIDALEKEALKYISPFEVATSTIPELLKLVDARQELQQQDVPAEYGREEQGAKKKRGPNVDTRLKLERLREIRAESITNGQVTIAKSKACEFANIWPDTVKNNDMELWENWDNPDWGI